MGDLCSGVSYMCVQAMWLMMQQDKPEDYVIATGEAHSVRELVELAFQEVGIEIVYVGRQKSLGTDIH